MYSAVRMSLLRGQNTFVPKSECMYFVVGVPAILYMEYPRTVYGMHALRRQNELNLYTE